jgi:NADH-dependent peroxiredoxin subunit F
MFQFNFEATKPTSTFNEGKLWDLLIIGGGPAGLNAALYAKRKGLSVGVLTKEIGGQLHNTSDVDNYLGLKLIKGEELSNQFLDHVNTLDIPIYKNIEVKQVTHQNPNFAVELSTGEILITKTLLVTTGGAPRKLEVPGETQFANVGVSYCTTCDAPFFKGKDVIVAGGGNSAAEAVLDLSVWAKSVTLVHRSQWRADAILLEKLNSIQSLKVYLETQILEILGTDHMTGIVVLDKKTNEKRQISADGLFIEIGTIPNSGVVHNLVQTNAKQEIIVDSMQMSSLPGLFAAGDVTDQPFKQIIISAAQGATAALGISHYLTHTYKGE